MQLTNEKIIIAVLALAVLVLGGILLFTKPLPPSVVTVTTTDTIWLTPPVDTQYLPAPVLANEHPQPIPPQHLPSADCDSLKGQYNYLAQNYFNRRTYIDTLTKDSITLVLSDTVENNRLKGRTAVWKVKYPQVTTTHTTTITNPPVRQLYAGGGVGATFRATGWQGRAGVLYKSRKDNITGLNVWGNNQLQAGVEVVKYWKISLNKN